MPRDTKPRCACGCGGAVVAVYALTQPRLGQVKGEPHKWLPGHQSRKTTSARFQLRQIKIVAKQGKRKRCAACRRLKPVNEFYPSKIGLFRRQGFCILCSKQSSTHWRKANPERVAQNKNASYHKWKCQVFDHYGWKCACCGETEILFLSLDHVNNDGGGRRRKITGYALYKLIVTQKFPKTYQVLCWNCNVGKQRNGGVCPHKQKHKRKSWEIEVFKLSLNRPGARKPRENRLKLEPSR